MIRVTRDVVREIVKKIELPQYEVKKVMTAYQEVIFDFLSQGDTVLMPKVGKFTVRVDKARKRRNRWTGEIYVWPTTRMPRFRFYWTLKQAVKANRRGLDDEEKV